MKGVYVEPKTDCPHALKLDIPSIQSRFTYETYSSPCTDCHDLSENWLCLSCEGVFCSRYVNGHMAEHNIQTQHPVALSFSDASVWCYDCDSYITNLQLRNLTRHFGDIKFGTHTDSASAVATTLPTISEDEDATEESNDHTDQELNIQDETKFSIQSEPGDTVPPNASFTRAELIQGLQNKTFRKIVILSGAGISVAAGIPDFRSPGTGLYSRLQELGLPFAEAVFQLNFFRENPKPFYEVAKWFLTLEGTPTKAHKFAKYLQNNDQLILNCTQNIDGLELKAGIPENLLLQAHGHLRTARCIDCHASYPMETFHDHLQRGKIYYCSVCNPAAAADDDDEAEQEQTEYKGLIKPDIVFFGEALPPMFQAAPEIIEQADLVLVMGTSLKVFPFAMLVHPVFCPQHIPFVLINRENPGLSRDRLLFLEGDIDTSIQSLVDELGIELP